MLYSGLVEADSIDWPLHGTQQAYLNAPFSHYAPYIAAHLISSRPSNFDKNFVAKHDELLFVTYRIRRPNLYEDRDGDDNFVHTYLLDWFLKSGFTQQTELTLDEGNAKTPTVLAYLLTRDN